ncbi:MAG: hypothetical protein N4A35_06215 [Flavobacteriales bacterium]|jgi:hypothetical protein|nr:hypothetical protein [Flavobacteriales bacterium]
MRLGVFFFLFFIGIFSVWGQKDSTKRLKDFYSLDGYVKEMQTNTFLNLDTIYTDHLIHNRLNIKAFISDELTLIAEMRNRAFYGELIKLQQPFYGDLLGQDHGIVDLSWLLVNEKSFILHSTIDRLNLAYSKGKWDVNLGRQRINWGVNLAWNPNDLFNVYNFADFDYTERPGADALRIQYYKSALSSFDLAIKPSRDQDKWVGALLYKFNKKNYDFQVLGGIYEKDWSLGGGWAGNIKNIGLKGEATYFHPQVNFLDSAGVMNAAISLDYAFANSLYFNVGVLYNTNGINSLSGINSTGLFSSTQELSVKSIMPSRYSYFVQTSGAFNPALSGSLSFIYLQGINVLFAMPSIAYVINESWDVNLVGQILYSELQNQFRNTSNAVFLRFQYSF